MRYPLAIVLIALMSATSAQGVLPGQDLLRLEPVFTGPAAPDAGISTPSDPAGGPLPGGEGAASAGRGRAEDWPMFMHDIHHTGCTTSKIPNTNATLWTYSTRGQIQSSAAIVDGVVYFGSGDRNLYALWANNGTLKWKFNDGNNLDEVPSSPAVVGDKVYFYAMNKGMFCLWASNGTKIWNRTLATPNYRNFSSPLVVNDSVYIANDLPNPATIFSLNASTGSTNWAVTYGEYIVSSMAYKNGHVFVGRQGGGVLCLWAGNGTEHWYGRPSYDGVYSSPSVSDDKVFFTSEPGWLYALHLANGTKAWQQRIGATTYTSPALSDGKVFVAGSAYHQSNGTQIWSWGYSQYSTPAVSGDRLVVLNGTNLTCQATTDGSVLWSAFVRGEYASPAIGENLVVIGGQNGTMHAFSTPDVTPPTVVGSRPEHLATGVAPDTNITVSFSELMEEAVTGAAFSISPAAPGSLSWSAGNMTFDPSAPLASETEYSVTVKGTAVDRSGNRLDGNRDGSSGGSPLDDHVFRFTTVVVPPPNITAVQPPPGATGVQPNARITVSFSQPMDRPATEAAFSMDPATAGTFSWDAGSGEMTFTPSANLVDKGTYNCTVTHLAAGLAGKPLDGNQDGILTNDSLDDFSWGFSVDDWIPPTVVSVSPEDGASAVPISSRIVVGFSEPMDGPSVEAALSADPAIRGGLSWNGTFLTLSPDAGLESDTEYTLAVAGSARDLSGLGLDGDGDGTGGGRNDSFNWSFRTAKRVIPPPRVEAVFPAANATGVPVGTEISVTFSKPMDRALSESAVTVNGSQAAPSGYSLSWDAQNLTLTLRPSANLSFGSDHRVRVAGSAASADGAGLDGDRDGTAEGAGTDDFEWSFRTADALAPPLPIPKIREVRPAPDATGVAVSSNILVTFSLEMNTTSVLSGILIDPPVQASTSWNANGTTLTIDPASDLSPGRLYRVSVSGGALSSGGVSLDGDLDGVAEGAPADDYAWSFRTAAPPPLPIPPALEITWPAGGETTRGAVNITGTVSDPDTPLAGISVEIMFDDSGRWIPAGNGPVWLYRWDTTLVKDGPHNITVRAFDGSSHSPQVTREVIVKNVRPTGPAGSGVDPFIPMLAAIAILAVAAALLARGHAGKRPPEPVAPPRPPP